MTSFQLVDSTFGWEGASVPDDLTVRVSDDVAFDLYVSLRDLLVLYGYLVNEEPVERVIGTNTNVVVAPEDESLVLQSGGRERALVLDIARRDCEELIREIFHEFDRAGEPSVRQSELNAIQSALDDTPYEFDVFELYSDLAE